MNGSADLVTRVCQGDSEAFRLIFERYSRPVISFIYDMVNDRGLAEELTQETFVRAFRAIHTMRTRNQALHLALWYRAQRCPGIASSTHPRQQSRRYR